MLRAEGWALELIQRWKLMKMFTHLRNGFKLIKSLKIASNSLHGRRAQRLRGYWNKWTDWWKVLCDKFSLHRTWGLIKSRRLFAWDNCEATAEQVQLTAITNRRMVSYYYKIKLWWVKVMDDCKFCTHISTNKVVSSQMNFKKRYHKT